MDADQGKARLIEMGGAKPPVLLSGVFMRNIKICRICGNSFIHQNENGLKAMCALDIQKETNLMVDEKVFAERKEYSACEVPSNTIKQIKGESNVDENI